MRSLRILYGGAALVLAGGLTLSGASASGAAPDRERGGPGSWTKVSTGGSGTTYQSSLYRTADGTLHVVYPKGAGNADRLGHTAIGPTGAIVGQNDVFGSAWSIMDSAPVVVAGPGGGMRVVFGGQQTTSAGYWSDGRMYTATAPASGASWTLPAEAVGESHSAYGSYGTAGTTLADGTPIAAFPLNSSITWHVGTGSDPDQTFDVAGCCAYDLTLVRDGDEVWLGWYANGSTTATNGTFVRRIYPTLGPITKAPGSSVGNGSIPAGRVALVARTGGGVYAAYCSGYPYCEKIALWKVGTSKVLKVSGSKYANLLALSAGPSGRLWLSWADNIPDVKALRTSRSVGRLGAVRNVHLPHGTSAVYDLAIEGSTGRGDVVIQVGSGFWHTQVLAGLAVKGKPGAWKHGKKQKVSFTVTDAGDALAGALVKVGARHCTTKASGTCAITFAKSTKKGRLVVTATRSGYTSARATLRVR